jgi:hypothetical protein
LFGQKNHVRLDHEKSVHDPNLTFLIRATMVQTPLFPSERPWSEFDFSRPNDHGLEVQNFNKQKKRENIGMVIGRLQGIRDSKVSELTTKVTNAMSFDHALENIAIQVQSSIFPSIFYNLLSEQVIRIFQKKKKKHLPVYISF